MKSDDTNANSSSIQVFTFDQDGTLSGHYEFTYSQLNAASVSSIKDKSPDAATTGPPVAACSATSSFEVRRVLAKSGFAHRSTKHNQPKAMTSTPPQTYKPITLPSSSKTRPKSIRRRLRNSPLPRVSLSLLRAAASASTEDLQ